MGKHSFFGGGGTFPYYHMNFKIYIIKSSIDVIDQWDYTGLNNLQQENDYIQ